MNEKRQPTFEVAIIGGGPAGLSAAITLGRACRRTVLFDTGKPRNASAHGVHCFLGSEGLSPHELRAQGRSSALNYDVRIADTEVVSIQSFESAGRRLFRVETVGEAVEVRAILLATGVTDLLPDIEGLREFYGRSVHHCPYCDGWEHRNERIATVGDKAVELAVALLNWSDQVTACTNSAALNDSERGLLSQNPIRHRAKGIVRVRGDAGVLKRIEFADDEPLECDAIFFSADQMQHSALPAMIGCEFDDESHVKTADSCCTSVEGVYLAGDASGFVQFAIAAAAEGAIAAVAIDKWLRKQDVSS